MFLSVVHEPKVPEVDLGFIISAGSSDAAENVHQLKDVIKSFIDKYAMHRLQYGIISYGKTPTIELTLTDSLKPDVTQRIEAIVMPSGTPDLTRALELGEQLLIPGRPNAEKVLVIITDVKSASSLSKVKLAAESLDDKDIRIFAVAVGNEADSTELAIASGSSQNVINSSNTDEPGKVREDIMDKVRQGKLCGALFGALLILHVFPIFTVCLSLHPPPHPSLSEVLFSINELKFLLL